MDTEVFFSLFLSLCFSSSPHHIILCLFSFSSSSFLSPHACGFFPLFFTFISFSYLFFCLPFCYLSSSHYRSLSFYVRCYFSLCVVMIISHFSSISSSSNFFFPNILVGIFVWYFFPCLALLSSTLPISSSFFLFSLSLWERGKKSGRGFWSRYGERLEEQNI